MLSRFLRRDDALTALLFGGLCVATALAVPTFLSLITLFDLLRAMIVPGIMAIGVHLVLVSGGIDVSFTAIAALAMYASISLVGGSGAGDFTVIGLAVAMTIGLGLGLINAFFIATLRLPTLIVTLGTLSLFRGILLTFFGTAQIPDLPTGVAWLGDTMLLKVHTINGSVGLPIAFLILAAAVVGAWLLLERSIVGRSIFAVGGSEIAAARLGINVGAIKYIVYGSVGALAALAGVVHAALNRVANPFDLVGQELPVIAAVVLGGARISGGHGTLFGTLLGVAFIALMSNTLIMWGVPTTWQNVVVGMLILIGTGLPALRARLRGRSI